MVFMANERRNFEIRQEWRNGTVFEMDLHACSKKKTFGFIKKSDEIMLQEIGVSVIAYFYLQ